VSEHWRNLKKGGGGGGGGDLGLPSGNDGATMKWAIIFFKFYLLHGICNY